MNFLQLCQAVASDSGTVAGVPNFITVVGASGRVAQVVGWTRQAYIDLQNEREDWRWMRQTFSHALTIDQIAYTATDLGITDFGGWTPDVPGDDWRSLSIYASGEQEQESELWQIAYHTFRQRYQRGVHDHNRPTEWAISPQDELLFGTKPDAAYIVTGEYRTAPETLTADADTPSMPVTYHSVIVQEALRLMARSDEAFQVLGAAADQYARLRAGLVRTQTPDVSFGGGSLA